MTLAQLRCPVMVVEKRNSCRPDLYHLRDVLVLERPRCTIVMVPHMPVSSELSPPLLVELCPPSGHQAEGIADGAQESRVSG